MISKEKGLSRSKYISLLLKETIAAEKQKQIREAYEKMDMRRQALQNKINGLVDLRIFLNHRGSDQRAGVCLACRQSQLPNTIP